MRVSFTTERNDKVSDIEALWLDRYGNVHEWAGDDWYLLGRRLEAEWQMPGGFKASEISIELIGASALGVGVADPTERPQDLLYPEAVFASMSLRHLSGFVRLCSSQAPFSLATLIPKDGAPEEQTWLLEADIDPPDLFLAAADAYIRPWLPISHISQSPRARPSALAERVVWA